MGTRNIVAVHLDGEYKVAQYGQWDGYPGGQGAVALRFLQTMDKEKFIKKCRAAHYLTPEVVKRRWVEQGADPGSDCVSLDIANKFDKKYPELSRDTGAKVLSIIQRSKAGIGLVNNMEFVSDSPFCEWAYVIDLDKNTFEVFQGFNTKPLSKSERFASFPVEKNHSGDQYYPVRLLIKFNLDKLPEEKAFLESCKRAVKRLEKK